MRQNEWESCLGMLGELTGSPVDVEFVESLGGDWAPVARLVLAEPVVSAIGRSVVVKTRRHGETGWGGDPLNLVAEHTALVVLDAAAPGLAPKSLAWDEANGVLVMSDLAPALPVEDLLRGGDAVAPRPRSSPWQR